MAYNKNHVWDETPFRASCGGSDGAGEAIRTPDPYLGNLLLKIAILSLT
ncbi:hypothetical protein SAMN05421759_10899 [Roseivivax lentus]|uniref:Uncharacterized protein n=1 Tax=Roseivivax lentus TaxID=633194 RepID=A0A1N7NHP9_9RHOB|nr:hypothetical protein SAMN05421759_10899 [Roseivivax lentus]